MSCLLNASNEFDRLNGLLVETVGMLCKNGLPFSRQLKVQGMLAVTIDENEIFLVHINECIGAEQSNNYSSPRLDFQPSRGNKIVCSGGEEQLESHANSQKTSNPNILTETNQIGILYTHDTDKFQNTSKTDFHHRHNNSRHGQQSIEKIQSNENSKDTTNNKGKNSNNLNISDDIQLELSINSSNNVFNNHENIFQSLKHTQENFDNELETISKNNDKASSSESFSTNPPFIFKNNSSIHSTLLPPTDSLMSSNNLPEHSTESLSYNNTKTNMEIKKEQTSQKDGDEVLTSDTPLQTHENRSSLETNLQNSNLIFQSNTGNPSPPSYSNISLNKNNVTNNLFQNDYLSTKNVNFNNITYHFPDNPINFQVCVYPKH